MKTRSIAFPAASLLALSVSHTGFAQDDSDATPTEADSASSAQQEPSAQEQKTPPSEGDEASEESANADDSEESAADEAQATDEPDEASASAKDSAAQSEASKSEASKSEASKGEASKSEAGEPKTGPGGKPLRDDYPGTEESKKARMDTDRIEGLAFEEGETSDEVYDVRIRELETKVDDLKEKVFRSKSRIVLLKETVLTGNLAGSRAIVSHETDLGGTYVLKRAHYSLDGSRVYNKTDGEGGLGDKKKFELYNGSIAPGNHRVSILLELQGSGYGVFSYMDGYKFTIKDSCEFSAQEGRSTVLKVRLIDRGGAFSSYEERPGIECVLNSVRLSSEGLDVDEAQESDTKPDGGAETPPDEDVSAAN
jgi:hypothetical protein